MLNRRVVSSFECDCVAASLAEKKSAVDGGEQGKRRSVQVQCCLQRVPSAEVRSPATADEGVSRGAGPSGVRINDREYQAEPSDGLRRWARVAEGNCCGMAEDELIGGADTREDHLDSFCDLFSRQWAGAEEEPVVDGAVEQIDDRLHVSI